MYGQARFEQPFLDKMTFITLSHPAWHRDRVDVILSKRERPSSGHEESFSPWHLQSRLIRTCCQELYAVKGPPGLILQVGSPEDSQQLQTHLGVCLVEKDELDPNRRQQEDCTILTLFCHASATSPWPDTKVVFRPTNNISPDFVS